MPEHLFNSLCIFFFSDDGGRNAAITRDSTPPNASKMVALRVIIVTIAVGEILREFYKV